MCAINQLCDLEQVTSFLQVSDAFVIRSWTLTRCSLGLFDRHSVMSLILYFVSVAVHTGSSHVAGGLQEGCTFVLLLVTIGFALMCPFQRM